MGKKMSWRLPLFKMYSDQDDIDAISKVIKRGTFWAGGPEIDQFEAELSEYISSKYVVTFNSGTSALHTLLLAHNLAGKEVIVPSYTFISTVNSIVLAGAKPVFADIEVDTIGLDVKDVIKKITDATAAIVIVHYAGFPARDTLLLKKVAEDHNLLFFEDVAESMGATIDQKKLGNFGDGGILSFCQNKIITTGEGGAIVTDSEEIYQKAKLIRSHGRLESGEGYFNSTGDMDYIQVGYNYRLSTLTAALGLSQLRKIGKIIEMRRNLANYLDKNIEKIPGIKTLKKIPNHFQVYQMYPIFLRDEVTRNKLQSFMTSKGIMTKVYFNPAHLKTLYTRDYGSTLGDLPTTEDIAKKELTLPFFPGMTENEVNYIVNAIKEFFTI